MKMKLITYLLISIILVFIIFMMNGRNDTNYKVGIDNDFTSSLSRIGAGFEEGKPPS